MSTSGIAVAVLLLGLAVGAGCVGSEGTDAAGDGVPASYSLDPSSDSGDIQGTVVDESVNPVPGAQIAVAELQLQAVSDVSGAFLIRGVPAGSHTLFAAALGYGSFAKKVEVASGSVSTVTITLSKLPVVEPYIETFGPFDGYFECRLGHANTGECGWVGNPQPHPTQIYPNDRSIFRFNLTSEEWQTFQGEMRWQQGSFATSTAMRLAFSYEERAGTHRWCSWEGPTPLVWRYDKEESELTKCADDGADNSDAPEPAMEYNPLRTYANVPFGGDPANPVYLSFQQRFQVIVSVFYGEPAPADFSAFPDA